MHVNASPALVMLAETPAPVFLMSVAKPALTLLATIAYVAVAVGKLSQDSQYYAIKPTRWSAIFLACGAVGLLLAMLLPWSWGWFLGFPLMLAAYVTPCWLYVKARNQALKGTKAPAIKFLNMDFAAMAAARRAKAAAGSVSLKFQKKDRSEHPIPDRKDPAYEVYGALEGIILPALESRASRVDIALSKQGAQLQQTVDSVRFKRDPIAGEAATKVVDLLKGFAGLDTNERRKFQRGTVPVLRDGERIVLTVASIGSMQGESIRIDVEREKQLTLAADKLGMTDAQLNALGAMTEGGGNVLLGARPANGLTALAYSMLGRHDVFLQAINTLEKRVERTVDGLTQQEFAPGQIEYAAQLQTIVRRAPDIVLVSDPLEAGAAKVMVSQNARSVLFYATLPSDNPLELLAAWVKAVGDPKAAADGLKGIVCERLVRTLCPACRVGAAPSPNEAKMLAIPAGKQVQIYRQSGKVLVKDQPTDCPTCKGTGFRGVTGAFEVLPFDAEAKALLAAGDVKGAYLHARRAAKSWSLQDSALAKVRAGETSFDEVKRVFAPPAAAGAAASPAAAAAPAAGAAKAK
jgi:type II secretory ATPase GspE/PulE/Tfp pilus assembly ATPase PilB-like protein